MLSKIFAQYLKNVHDIWMAFTIWWLLNKIVDFWWLFYRHIVRLCESSSLQVLCLDDNILPSTSFSWCCSCCFCRCCSSISVFALGAVPSSIVKSPRPWPDVRVTSLLVGDLIFCQHLRQRRGGQILYRDIQKVPRALTFCRISVLSSFLSGRLRIWVHATSGSSPCSIVAVRGKISILSFRFCVNSDCIPENL